MAKIRLPKKVVEAIGPGEKVDRDEARDIAKDMLADVRKDGDPSNTRKEKRQAPTVVK